MIPHGVLFILSFGKSLGIGGFELDKLDSLDLLLRRGTRGMQSLPRQMQRLPEEMSLLKTHPFLALLQETNAMI